MERHIENDNLIIAIKEGLDLTRDLDKELETDLKVARWDLNAVEKAKKGGLISWENAHRGRRQIAYRLFDIVKEIKSLVGQR